MNLYARLTGLEAVLAKLRAAQLSAAEGSAATREAFRVIGELELAEQKSDFVDRSRGAQAAGFGWQRISPLTALLRRTGRTAKLAGWAQVVELAKSLPVGVDTGRMLASLAPGAAGNVLRPEGLAVTVGTNVEYAERFSEGGPASGPAIPSREDADRVVGSKILKVLPGHKAAQTAGGRASRAKKNWNREFFRLRGWLRKRAGVVFQVPARPILSVPPAERLESYGRRVLAAIGEALG